MLEKKIVTGLITIMEDKTLQVREDTVVYEDGVEISRTYMRYVTSPGDDISGKPQIIKDVAGLLWTPEVIQVIKDRFAKSVEKLSKS